jgi:Holliday junction resolvasome RuvABC endonuclease subunit
MAKNSLKILAIDPGTRRMGIAFMEQGELIYYGVKVIKRRKSPHETLKEGRKAILIKDFRPEVLVVEKAFSGFARFALLKVFVDDIKAIGKRKGLKVVSFAPSTVKKFICGNGRAAKSEVARAVVAKYPELKVFLSQDRAWKERFHQNMFDAVALGTVFYSKNRRNLIKP